MKSTAQAWAIARDIAAHQGTGSKEWYGLAHLILTLPSVQIEVIEEPIDDGEPNPLSPLQVQRLIAQLDDAQLPADDMPAARIIVTNQDPAQFSGELITNHEVNYLHAQRERIRQHLRNPRSEPLVLCMTPDIYRRFSNMEGQPGLEVIHHVDY